ncbi:transposase [Azospirillum sp. INR13]|nr:zinc ribbon domain-containing protein [Azospirillum sp. INR13]MBF5093617.1 transposase [Azospirillum sp. INR13]
MARKGKNPKDGSKSKAVLRCDPLPHAMNPGKLQSVLALFSAWRAAACIEQRHQWRLFFEGGRFEKMSDAKLTVGLVGAAREQMVRHHVVGQLRSWVSNRANEFRAAVLGSTLPEATRHMLLIVNACEAWFRRDEMVMRESGETIPGEVRKLARSIMRGVMSRHSRPSMHRTSMQIDQRQATLERTRNATGRAPTDEAIVGPAAPRFAYWLKLATLEHRTKPDGTSERAYNTVWIPLRTTAPFERRRGARKLTIQVSQDRETKAVTFGVVTDITDHAAAVKMAYAPKAAFIALDFGLKALFATSEGDLLGRGVYDALIRYDQRLTTLARHIQRSGGKPRDSECYRRLVTTIRGFIKAEVNRVLNRIISLRRPKHLVLERLRFRSPGLSARLNRILQNCGRGVIIAKLTALEEELGVTSEEVNPAYSSQQCNCCGYVDSRNRTEQARFRCRWCGARMSADVNAGRNVGERRSSPETTPVGRTKSAALAELVCRFNERWPRARTLPPDPGRKGQRGLPADPRWTNPYFRDWASAARLALGSASDLGNLPTTPALVAVGLNARVPIDRVGTVEGHPQTGSELVAGGPR